jgi:S-formylglutathione hydrolase FrmB
VRFHDGDGLHILSQRQLDPRLFELSLHTSALPAPANVRVLVPAGYGRTRRRYPVLYLLHGTSGSARDWTTVGGAEQATSGHPLIVVMPDIALGADGGGWCTDWPSGQYRWETFHIGQLLPWIDANLRTRPRRSQRAIAGLSQGGFCSTSYPARHPDLFAAAFSYSGAPDIAYDPEARIGATAIINGTEVGLDHVPPNSIFGDPISNEINWAAHDPATLANNLRATKLYLYFGNGQAGPYDGSSADPSASGIESLVYQDNIDFHNRLQSLHIPSLYDPYGNGSHSWPYWARDLRWSIGPLMADFAHPAPPPAEITYTSADPSYSVYGWQVTMHRTAREFSTLQGASCGGFTLAGSGSASVVTPACVRPGRRYRVTLSGDRVRSTTASMTAGHDRRLTLTVPLGPSNPYQQDTALAQLAGTAVYRTHVTVATTLTPR